MFFFRRGRHTQEENTLSRTKKLFSSLFLRAQQTARALDDYHHSTIFTKKFKNIITAYKMGGGLGAFFLCFRTRNQPRVDDDRPTDRRVDFLFFFSSPLQPRKRPILSSLFLLLLLLLCARADHFLSLSLSLFSFQS